MELVTLGMLSIQTKEQHSLLATGYLVFQQISIKLLKTAFATFQQSLNSLLQSYFPNSYHLTAAAVKTLLHMKHAIHSALEQHSLQKLRANPKLSI